MEFQMPIRIPSLPQPIRYGEKILLTGSCFTEHIGNSLGEWKFDVLQNPNGILFDPASVAGSLLSYIDGARSNEDELVFFNELWQSWQHHSIFSNTDKDECLRAINNSRRRAHDFLKEARWLIVTLGSAFSYRLLPDAPKELRPGDMAAGKTFLAAAGAGGEAPYHVANCHRAPAQVFQKHLMTIEEITTVLDHCLHRLFLFNPAIRVIFTVSPVRHIRDGAVENNRSKARLIESVHELIGRSERSAYGGMDGHAEIAYPGRDDRPGAARLWYFPAYELVIDVLRDYRFYDIDLVHPNYAATGFVLENFVQYCVDPSSRQLLEEVKKIVTARKHKPFQPATEAHKRFLRDHWEKTTELARQYPFLDLREELEYFSN
jgi:hypothetical protein